MRKYGFPLLLLLLAQPSQANIVARADGGFLVRHVVEVTAAPEETWQRLVTPAEWWNGEHSFSGDARNLTIDPRAGGCFCEALPGEGAKGAVEPRGGVEHMRVIFVDRNKALRMTGALGPLQSEPVTGVLTITLKPMDGGGTRVTWEYGVSGWMRYKQEQIAPAVDRVIGEQLTRLAEKLGPKPVSEPSASPTPAPGMESGR